MRARRAAHPSGWRLAAGLLAATVAGAASAPPPPHVLLLLLDDWGHANLGAHRSDPAGRREVLTPNMDGLIAAGRELTQAYVHKFCSPSRSALQTGRLPLHVNVLNLDAAVHNPGDPMSGFAGIPRNMTGLAEKMKKARYATHMVGKWDAGMATPAHTPAGRGYDSSLNYHHHENDYWNQTVKSMNCTAGGAQPVDFWDTVGPAFGQNNSLACSQANQAAGCEYEDAKFTRRVLEIVAQHDPAQPLFLFWAPHSVHVPLEVPAVYLDRFAFIDDPQRRSYAAMVNFIDEAIGNVTAALQARGMWESTLLWAFADNGGSIMGNGVDGASNWPLRGGKYSNFQGGVRANCFVSGGLVPAGVRGTPVPGLVSIADVYTTLCALAGVDPADDRAAAAGLPPVDGLDMWPLLSGANATGPRADVPLGTSASPDPDVQSGTVVQGVVRADGWKLLINEVTSAVWTGPQYPNGSTWVDTPHPCGDPLSNVTAKKGCLFNVLTDPSEYDDVAEAHPDIVLELRARITQWQATAFAPERGGDDGAACRAAMSTWRGFWGPFLP